MKKIALLSLLLLSISSCKLFEKAQDPYPVIQPIVKPEPEPEMTEHESENVYAFVKPLSEYLPLTSMKFKIDGKDKEFKLVELSKKDGSTPLVYIPVELYEKIKPKLTVTAEEWEKMQQENKFVGFQLSASSLGTASVFTDEQMEAITDSHARNIAKTYRYQYKYIVWSLVYYNVTGHMNTEGKIIPDGLNYKPDPKLEPENKEGKKEEPKKQKRDWGS